MDQLSKGGGRASSEPPHPAHGASVAAAFDAPGPRSAVGGTPDSKSSSAQSQTPAGVQRLDVARLMLRLARECKDVFLQTCGFLHPNESMPAMACTYYRADQKADQKAEADRWQQAGAAAHEDHGKNFWARLDQTKGKVLEGLDFDVHPELLDRACRYLAKNPGALRYVDIEVLRTATIRPLIEAAISGFGDRVVERDACIVTAAAFHRHSNNLDDARVRLVELRKYVRNEGGAAQTARKDGIVLLTCNPGLLAFADGAWFSQEGCRAAVGAPGFGGSAMKHVPHQHLGACLQAAIEAFTRDGGTHAALPARLIEWTAGDGWLHPLHVQQRCVALVRAGGALENVSSQRAVEAAVSLDPAELEARRFSFNPALVFTAQHPVSAEMQDRAIDRFLAEPQLLRGAWPIRLPGIVAAMIQRDPAGFDKHLTTILEATDGAALAGIDLIARPQAIAQVSAYLALHPGAFSFLRFGNAAKDSKGGLQVEEPLLRVLPGVFAKVSAMASPRRAQLWLVQMMAESALGCSWRTWDDARHRFDSLRQAAAGESAQAFKKIASLDAAVVETQVPVGVRAPHVALSRGCDHPDYATALSHVTRDAYGYLAGIPADSRAPIAEDLLRLDSTLVGAWRFVAPQHVAEVMKRVSAGHGRTHAAAAAAAGAAAREAGIDVVAALAQG